MASQAVTWTALLLAGISMASPIVYFPINSQVPPVARVGQFFSFVFSPSTFSSTSKITYHLAQHPSWLSIDSDARRLFGTPSDKDVVPGLVVGVPLSLVASDAAGSTLLPATLVVSRNPGPTVEIPFEEQVPDFGMFSTPSSLLSAPEKDFSFALEPATFSTTSDIPLSYYATMADNTPLPAWISFDPSNLSFAGRTPPSGSLVQPPQSFSIRLVASDVAGFAGASLVFDIVVGTHCLVADYTTIILRAVPGISVLYSTLRDTVSVDGKPAIPETVVIASTSNVPPWLTVDKTTWIISGMPPEAVTSSKFTITLRDDFTNTLNLTVAVEVAGDLTYQANVFNDSLPSLTIIPGRRFSFDFQPYLVDSQRTELSVVTNSSYPWIRFESSTVTLFGETPRSLPHSIIDIEVNARPKDSNKVVSTTLRIRVQAGSEDTPSAHPTESPGEQLSLAGDGLEYGQFNVVLFAVLFPVLLLLVAAACPLFWWFRRRKERQISRFTIVDVSGLPASPEGPRPPPATSKCSEEDLSSNDTLISEQLNYVSLRNAFTNRRSLPQTQAKVWLLSPTSTRSRAADGQQGGSSSPVRSASVGRARPRPRLKISSSLSSITETSVDDEGDGSSGERTLRSRSNDSDMSSRDYIEGSIPQMPRFSGSMYIDETPRPCDSMETSTQQASSFPVADLDPEEPPLRAKSRLPYHPPASAPGRFAWSWLTRKNITKGQWRISHMMTKWSKKSITTTGGTLATSASGQSGKASELTAPELSSMPGSTCPSSRPATLCEGASSDLEDQRQDSVGTDSSRRPNFTTPAPSLASSKGQSSTSGTVLGVS
ncbi:hypothetical protein N656DRAFT_796943 [Canariomyces notabilis]|uniref:Dystroglycan-type cadherin-like domain-containing protein n=1 Tax=Canariomyces notabilis TaxID=2074819 RepID=A0AAN6TFV4_9PEZI|nr:hypothetical protein N656DRAFT_796943 [Canariomyces arenarius]